MYHLLQAFPGYTRATLEEEDADLIADWLTILDAKAAVQKEEDRKRGK